MNHLFNKISSLTLMTLFGVSLSYNVGIFELTLVFMGMVTCTFIHHLSERDVTSYIAFYIGVMLGPFLKYRDYEIILKSLFRSFVLSFGTCYVCIICNGIIFRKIICLKIFISCVLIFYVCNLALCQHELFIICLDIFVHISDMHLILLNNNLEYSNKYMLLIFLDMVKMFITFVDLLDKRKKINYL